MYLVPIAEKKNACLKFGRWMATSMSGGKWFLEMIYSGLILIISGCAQNDRAQLRALSKRAKFSGDRQNTRFQIWVNCSTSFCPYVIMRMLSLKSHQLVCRWLLGLPKNLNVIYQTQETVVIFVGATKVNNSSNTKSYFKRTLVHTCTCTRLVMWPLFIALDVHRTPDHIAKHRKESWK